MLERNFDSVVQVLTFNAFTRPDLKLPLCRHDLSVDTGNFDASEQAGFVVSLDDVTAEYLVRAYTTIVRALWSWEAALGPTVWPTVRS